MSDGPASAEVVLGLPVLRRGDGGPTVERIQSMLNVVGGIDRLIVDGAFGPKTEAAVRDFQQNENLTVDGIVGRQTWTALLTRFLLFSPPG